jgi:hypothetical protein
MMQLFFSIKTGFSFLLPYLSMLAQHLPSTSHEIYETSSAGSPAAFTVSENAMIEPGFDFQACC